MGPNAARQARTSANHNFNLTFQYNRCDLNWQLEHLLQTMAQFRLRSVIEKSDIIVSDTLNQV